MVKRVQEVPESHRLEDNFYRKIIYIFINCCCGEALRNNLVTHVLLQTLDVKPFR